MQTNLSHYRILEQIGAGGMGVVYRAHDERLDRDVALKVLSPGTVVEASARKRFHKEALMLSKLNHPNIATVHDFDAQDGNDFLVEEFIDGLSLDAMLASGPLTEREIIHLGSQMAEGLAAAHEQGVIHRDLKPSNVRVTPDARLKVLDFGLAMIIRREVSLTAVTESLPEVKLGAGTLPYMAPEQLLGNKLDARTDIWAIGCVLYEMATGRRPFAGSGPALIEGILHRLPAAASKLNPVISAALDSVIQKCLDKDPAKRYQSAREIAVDLQRAVSSPYPAGKRFRLPRWLPLLIVALALAAVTGIVLRPQLERVLGGKHVAGMAPESAMPHELYLAGQRALERWDKTANLDAAIGFFQQTVKADPNFALGYSALGEAYWAKYRLEHDPHWIDEAEQNCGRAAVLNDKLPAVYVTLARVHNGKGQYNLALQEIQQALKLEPRDPDALLAEAALYASMGRQDEAEDTYKRAAALRPQRWGGYYELGSFYYRQQRYAEAAQEFERVLEITPDNTMAHATLGVVMQLLGKDAEAEIYLKRSIELQPSYAGYNNLGTLYYREKRWEESALMTHKALELNANDWRAWSNLRLANEWMKRTREADEASREELVRLEEVAKVNSDDADVLVELGVLYSKLKLRGKALRYIEAALARSPDDPAVLVSAGEAYENMGDRARALELVTHALAKGWTLAQLENDPGQQQIIREPRFQNTVRLLPTNPVPLQH